MSRIVVTAQTLEDWLRAGRVIELPRDALITPAARDWIKEHDAPVTWCDAGPASGVVPGGAQIVIDLTVPMLRSVLATLERTLGTVETIDPSAKAGGVIPAVQALCTNVKGGQASRGVIFCDDGALAVCIANKCAGVRAALATSVPAVEQAVRQLAINVLVLEASQQTMHQVRQMVQRFVSLRPGDGAAKALAAIAAMEGGGDAHR